MLAFGTEDFDEDGGIVPVVDDQVGFPNSVANLRDVTEAQHRSVAAAQQDDLLEVLLGVVLAERADAHLRLLGVDGACREIQRAPADRFRAVGEGESEGPKPVNPYLDRDLLFANPAHIDLRDGAKRRDLVLDLVRWLLQRALGHIAVHDEPHHDLAACHLTEQGAFGTDRE